MRVVSQADRAPAARQVLQVLDYLGSRQGPVSASGVATALGIPRSSLYQLLAVMTEQGYVLHLPDERKYGLGPKAYQLSLAYTRQDPLARIARPMVEQLVDELKENCAFALRSGREVFYIASERARFRPSTAAQEGVRLPLHLTASGRAILAHMPQSQVDALYPSADQFEQLTEDGTIRTPKALRAELERTRERGYGFEENAVLEDRATVACVVKDHLGVAIGALNTTYFAPRMSPEHLQTIVRALQQGARQVSLRLGADPALFA